MNPFKSQSDDLNDPRLQGELEKLAKRLKKSAVRANPDRAFKKRLKSQLLSAIREKDEIKEYQGLIGSIQKLAQSVSAPQGMRTNMRRKVLNYISLDLGSFSMFEVGFSGVFRRTVWATVMIFVISFVSIFTFELNTPIAYAKDSRLASVAGDVYVYRDGMLQSAWDGFVLEEGDKIHTGYGSSVTAIFMDDTVSRVAGESKLNVKTLYSNPENITDTQVTLGVKEGRVWSKVNSLLDGSFNVATLHTVVTAERNATFDVHASSDEAVEVSVVENFVDVQLSSYSPAVETTVVEGESLIVRGEDSMIVSLDTKDEWLRMNMSKDEFEARLLAQEDSQQREDALGALPTDGMYGVKTFKENLGVVLSLNEREKLQNQIMIAQKRLAEAEFLVQRGLSGNAEEVLREYKQIMLDLSREYPKLVGIAEVEEQLDAMIAQDKRRFYTTLPGSSLYDVKEVVDEVELLVANDRVRANQIALNQASDELYQVFELVEHGGEALAEVSVDDYLVTLDSAFEHLDTYAQGDRAGYVHAAFDTALSDLKTLNALEETLTVDSGLDVTVTRDQVLERLDQYLALVKDEELYSEFAYELEKLQVSELDELVELSEFTGVNEENAATVNVELEEPSGDDGVESEVGAGAEGEKEGVAQTVESTTDGELKSVDMLQEEGLGA